AQEGVEFQAVGESRADDGAVLDAPVLAEALPAGEVLAVEEGIFGVGTAGGTAGPGREQAQPCQSEKEVAHRYSPKPRIHVGIPGTVRHDGEQPLELTDGCGWRLSRSGQARARPWRSLGPLPARWPIPRREAIPAPPPAVAPA